MTKLGWRLRQESNLTQRASEARAWNPPGRRQAVPQPGIEPGANGFVDHCLESTRTRGDGEMESRSRRGRERSRTPHPCECVLLSRQSWLPASFSSVGDAWMNKRASFCRRGPGRGSAHRFADVRAGTHAERDISRARSPQYGCQSSGRSPSSRRIGGTTGRVSGFSGLRSSFIPASSGVRLPLRSLQA